MSGITIQNLQKRYGPSVAVENFNLTVEQGELVVFLGPSGCGKTTTLKMIAGFVDPTGGTIHLGPRDITRMPAYDRDIGVVFQNYALFPHLSVFENVAFGLRRRKVTEASIKDKVAAALDLVKMGHLSKRMPRELSGGQQQRVAIARAIVIEPDILLLDEPLSNLDAKLRLNIRQEIRNLQKTLGITTILVTHDQEEAMSIADRLVVMNKGSVQQIGAPAELYSKPANRFVADFIGGANFFEGAANAGTFRTRLGTVLSAPELSDDTDCVVIRPERIRLLPAPNRDEPNSLAARVVRRTFLGAGSLYEVELEAGDKLNVHCHGDADFGAAEGDNVAITVPPSSIMGLVEGKPRPEDEQ